MKKRKLSLLLSLLIVPCFASCTLLSPSNQDEKSDTPSEQEDSKIPYQYQISKPDFSAPQRNSKEEVTFDDLFNLHNKVEIQIEVDREELQKINDDNYYGGDFDSIKPETYHLAKRFSLTLHNGNKTFSWELENVGIRQKGNTSRKPIFYDNGDVREKNHYKISFDETFTDTAMYSSSFIAEHGNATYKDRELLGLSGLDIKWNQIDDSTNLKEIYSNMVLRSAGVFAQNIGLGTMKMIYYNDKVADFGLCKIYEPSSKSMIKRALESSTSYINMPSWKAEKNGSFGIAGKKYGDLYKGSYGKGDGASSGANFTTSSISGNKLGVKTDITGHNWPTYERKTNTAESYNDTQMRELVALLNKSITTFEAISEKVDIEQLAMEEAVMYFLGNPDAMRYNYNNYMAYFRRTDGKLIIIPIDNDRCLGVGKGWTDGMNFIMNKSQTPTNSKSIGGSQKNPLLNKTIFASGENDAKANYQKCLELVKNSDWLKNETFEQYYNILKTTYQGEATFSLNGGTDNVSFSSYLSAKLAAYK